MPRPHLWVPKGPYWSSPCVAPDWPSAEEVHRSVVNKMPNEPDPTPPHPEPFIRGWGDRFWIPFGTPLGCKIENNSQKQHQLRISFLRTLSQTLPGHPKSTMLINVGTLLDPCLENMKTCFVKLWVSFCLFRAVVSDLCKVLCSCIRL